MVNEANKNEIIESKIIKKSYLYITLYSKDGNFIQIGACDVNADTLSNMSYEEYYGMYCKIYHLLSILNPFDNALKAYDSVKSEAVDFLCDLRHSITLKESYFIHKINKGEDFLNKGYNKLKSSLCDKQLEAFDNNLCAIFMKIQEYTDIVKQLAEDSKELAVSTEDKDVFVKAAFWFRLLYASGAHSSYLDDCNIMIAKSREKGKD